jgi:hypothetical protein
MPAKAEAPETAAIFGTQTAPDARQCRDTSNRTSINREASNNRAE